MIRRLHRILRRIGAGPLVALAVGVAGCADRPVNGGQGPALMSETEEAALGASQAPALVRQYGGRYDDPVLSAYVEGVGRRVAMASSRPDLDYSFTVLDTDAANALALPGGRVYITRGLLALANSEAELAAVLAHEIAHLTARHTAARQSQMALARRGVGVLGPGGGGPVVHLAGLGGRAYIDSYSRGQEREADATGIAFLQTAGYDPGAMARILAQIERDRQLRLQIAGTAEPSDDFFDTHPRTADRVADAARIAAAAGDGDRHGDRYLAMVDGLPYDPDRRPVPDSVEATAGAGPDVPPGFVARASGDTVVTASGGARSPRLRVVVIGPDDTVEAMAGRMVQDGFAMQRFLTLNGLDGFAPLPRGRKVKLIVP